MSATVSTIPTTATIVVVVVTVAIAFERVHRTRSIAIDSRVLACTIYTVLVPLIGTATVAPVPSTATNIISVIAIFVALPSLDTRLSVRFLSRTFFWSRGFIAQTFALAAITPKLRLESLASIIRFDE